MKQDGIAAEKIKMFEIVHNLIHVSHQKGLPLPPPPNMLRRRTSVTMQKIHWKTVAKDKINNSLWAQQEDDASIIDDSEVVELESLFGAKPASKKAKRSCNSKSKERIKKDVCLIDLKRANNIAISLAQFKAFHDYDALCQSVVSMDSSNLNVEKLQNMQALLPTTDEVRRMKSYKGGRESLGRCEHFFLAVAKIPRFGQKLYSFVSSLQFTDLVNELKDSLHLIKNACDEITSNRNLAGMLRRLLAVGNLVNEGAGKPRAEGITIDSLLKTANKKGSDGKTSVIDHVVSTLLKQNESGSFVNFGKEMSSVKSAARLNVKDSRVAFRDLQNSIKKVETIISVEKKDAENEDPLFVKRSEDFVRNASKMVEEVHSIMEDVENAFNVLCSFFAEDSKKCQVSILLLLIHYI
jgi:hypothetical protein